MKHLLFVVIMLLTCWRCTPPRTDSGGKNKFSDAGHRQIYTYQDERRSADLRPFLKHKNAVYREAAALAFASIQDKAAIPALAALLQDKQPAVRQAAAYALGQTFDTQGEPALLQAAAKETQPSVQAALLEALGKCASQTGLDYLATLSASDEKIKAGQAWGLYRAHNKKLRFTQASAKAVDLLNQTQPLEARLGAGHFLARTPDLDLGNFHKALSDGAVNEPAAEVRMALAQALGKLPSATPALLHLLQKDVDYRVRINVLKALSHSAFPLFRDAAYQALKDPQVHTALAAAELLLARAPAEEAATLLKQAQQARNWRVRATLLAAALKNSPHKKELRTYIVDQYQSSGNLYEKGALLSALSQDIEAYAFIEEQTFNSLPVLGTYGLQALIDIRTNPAFPATLAPHFAALFQRAIASGDVALVGLAAGALQQPALQLQAAYADFSFLKTALSKLQLPRDMEAYLELEKAILLFEGRQEASAVQNPFTHPIDWQLVRSLRPEQQVHLQTSKGLITLELLVEAAPGTVANFVKLIQEGFFRDKNFHRVVPNFVVQGGDPRGDGWGAPAYAIRTELANLRFREGFMGMASAGKDTEGFQWFITHSPTPHLDGRYSIFARVIAGMAVVHQLEIGDKIESIELAK